MNSSSMILILVLLIYSKVILVKIKVDLSTVIYEMKLLNNWILIILLSVLLYYLNMNNNFVVHSMNVRYYILQCYLLLLYDHKYIYNRNV